MKRSGSSRGPAAVSLLVELIGLLPGDQPEGEPRSALAPLLERIIRSGLAEAAAIVRGADLLAGSGLSTEESSRLVSLASQRPPRMVGQERSWLATWESIDTDTSLVLLRTARLTDPEDQALVQGIARLLHLHQHARHQLMGERQAREEALDQAGRDPLTGLPNRMRALTHLERILSLRTEAEEGGAGPAVLFIDLDNFKGINDAHGHGIGDHFLITVSKILRTLVQHNDLVARLAGDEFIVICQEQQQGEANQLADKIISAIARPMTIGSCILSHSASIGIARVSPLDRAETVIENADLAMMQAKRLGRGRSNCFDLELRAAARARASTEEALKLAIQNQQIHCWFQPIVQLPSGRITGFEALARWQDPERGLIPPIEFIPVAESSGLIAEIDALIMRQACTAMAAWQQLAPPGSLHISTNLSARSLHDHQIGDQIEEALRDSGLNSEALYVEITETMLVDNIESATRTMAKLRQLGVKLAIDDFGTGYSSLRYLKQFPVGFLKIDKSFTDGLGQGGHDDVIIAAVIRMATALGLEVITEGVERQEQATLLAGMGCHFAQGYFFGRPIDTASATRLLEEQRQGPSDAPKPSGRHR